MNRLQILIDELSKLTNELTECNEYRGTLVIILNAIDYSVSNRAYIDTYVEEYYATYGQTWHWVKYDWSEEKRMFKAIAEQNG